MLIQWKIKFAFWHNWCVRESCPFTVDNWLEDSFRVEDYQIKLAPPKFKPHKRQETWLKLLTEGKNKAPTRSLIGNGYNNEQTAKWLIEYPINMWLICGRAGSGIFRKSPSLQRAVTTPSEEVITSIRYSGLQHF